MWDAATGALGEPLTGHHNRRWRCAGPISARGFGAGRKVANPAAADALEGAFDVESDDSVGERVAAIMPARTPKTLSYGVAPPVGLEPTTLRLTVACSAN